MYLLFTEFVLTVFIYKNTARFFFHSILQQTVLTWILGCSMENIQWSKNVNGHSSRRATITSRVLDSLLFVIFINDKPEISAHSVRCMHMTQSYTTGFRGQKRQISARSYQQIVDIYALTQKSLKPFSLGITIQPAATTRNSMSAMTELTQLHLT